MPYNQYGQWVQDPMHDHRIELLRQRDAIDYRLSEIERRYPAQNPPSQSMTNQTQPSANQISQPFKVVADEKEARDYIIVNSITDDIGKIHFFVTGDESTLFAKRINPSTFEMEFEIYDKRIVAGKAPEDVSGENNLLESIDTRLQKIEQFVDNAFSMLMPAQPNAAPVPETVKPKMNKPSIKKEESEV